jgi:hypothetical protein
MNEVQMWVLLAGVFILYATVEFLLSVFKKKPLWRSVKDWLIKILDVLSGG